MDSRTLTRAVRCEKIPKLQHRGFSPNAGRQERSFMKFITQDFPATALKTGAVIVGVFAGSKESITLTPSAQVFKNTAALADLLASGDVTGKSGKVNVVALPAKAGAARVVLVGLGEAAKLTAKSYMAAVRAGVGALTAGSAADALLTLNEIEVPGLSTQDKARLAVMAALDATYRFDTTKSKKDPALKLTQLALACDAKSKAAVASGIAQGQAVGEGQALAKTLGNLPANVCTPTYLASTAKKIGKQFKMAVDVLDRKQCEAVKMGSFLSVARGSEEPPKFIVIKHMGGAKNAAPVVLVGKGITFDTGGISLKPSDAMDEMKFDMCGAASVLGTMHAVGQLKLKLNVIGIVPACENMPSGRATKPGDVITSMSGQTVEVLNTDAEGRLILNDALHYAKRFKPAAVIDIATLTGAMVIALGYHTTGMFSNNDALANALLTAAQQAVDSTWRMPLVEEHHDGLKSNFADMANIAGRPGSAITAACFLEKYVDEMQWAHLDIAGTAWKSGAAKGATGRPVPLLTHYLMAQAR
jgi:leucyl aminopeptidase